MKILFALALLLLIPIAVWMVWSWRGEVASAALHNAWGVTNGRISVTPEFCEANGIPAELRARDEVALFLFKKAARFAASRSNAYYNLGLWYLDNRDCDKAEMYFRKHARYVPDSEKMRRIIEAFSSGCESVRTVVREELWGE